MSIPLFVDGETELDAVTLNRLVNAANARYNALNYDDIDPTGTTDSSAGIAAMLAAVGNDQAQATSGADIVFPPGEYLLDTTVDFDQFNGRIQGAGRGNSPLYTDQPGNATVFRWNGTAGQPMFRIYDSMHVIFEHFRMEGKDGAIPSYAFESVAVDGDGAGTNSYQVFRDLYIGRYPWTSQGIHKGDVGSGIGYTGHNSNNDEFQVERVVIANPVSYGVYLPNTQSLGASLNDIYIYSAGVAGIATGSSIQGSNWNFYDCAIDIQALQENTNVYVAYVYSEACEQFLSLAPLSQIEINGGAVQVGAVISGGEVLIDAFPSSKMRVALHGIKFTQMTDATKARFEFGPIDPYVGRFLIDVKGCDGIVPTQLVFGSGASMWAEVPVSKGVVEWQSTNEDDIYQFRNELRQSGSGTRTTLDYSVWDTPITD